MPGILDAIGGSAGVLGIGTGFGMLAGGISAQIEANNLKKQMQQMRRQMTESAGSLRALENKEGATAQMAYNWAASMMRKNRDNPNTVGMIGQNLNNTLTAVSDRTSQYRAAAAQLMSQRPIVPRTQNAWLTGMMKGGISGLGAGFSLLSNFTK